MQLSRIDKSSPVLFGKIWKAQIKLHASRTHIPCVLVIKMWIVRRITAVLIPQWNTTMEHVHNVRDKETETFFLQSPLRFSDGCVQVCSYHLLGHLPSTDYAISGSQNHLLAQRELDEKL